jgi:hypothetical protein
MKRLLLAGLVIVSTTVAYEDFGHAASGGHHGPHPPKKLNTKPNLTGEDAWTYNAETDIYRGTVYLSQGVTYSAKYGWDFGLASYNTPLYGGGAQNYENDTYLSLAKTFIIDPKDVIIVGTQAGTTFATAHREMHLFHFANFRRDLTPWLTTYVGPYYANANLTTTVDQVGFMTGFVGKIFPGTLHIQGDYVSGHQNVSGASVNLQWYVKPEIQLYTGVIVPERDSGNEFAGVIGFNVSTKSLN